MGETHKSNTEGCTVFYEPREKELQLQPEEAKEGFLEKRKGQNEVLKDDLELAVEITSDRRTKSHMGQHLNEGQHNGIRDQVVHDKPVIQHGLSEERGKEVEDGDGPDDDKPN